MKKSMARVLAVQNGQQTYTPEKPCAKGHLLRAISGTCVECRRQRENERVSANRIVYNARKLKERQHRLPDIAIKAKIARLAETPEQSDARLEKAKIKQREWRLKNPKHAGAYAAKKAYKRANPGKVRADTAKRRAAKMNRTPSWLSIDDHWLLEQAYDLAALRTRLFGFVWHVDHVLPLQGKHVSGLHVPTNLQVIPGADNVSKANKYLPA